MTHSSAGRKTTFCPSGEMSEKVELPLSDVSWRWCSPEASMSQISNAPLRLLQKAMSEPRGATSGQASKAGSVVSWRESLPSGLIETMSAPAPARSATAMRPPSPTAAGPNAAAVGWAAVPTRGRSGAEPHRRSYMSAVGPPVPRTKETAPHRWEARSLSCSPDRIRTGATALRGRRPRPLDDGAVDTLCCF